MFEKPATALRLPEPADLLDLIMPRHCLLCGAASGTLNLCPTCRADLPRTQYPCRLCALPLRHRDSEVCGACLRRPPLWDQAVAGLDYRFPVDRLVCRLKFSRDLPCVEVLGMELVAAVQGAVREPPDLIVPVPLHRTREFVRNFNQADLIARRVGKVLGIHVARRLLLRKRRTPAQSGLDAAQRKRNIRGAFHCGARGGGGLAGRHVALVDDVMTTGTTLAECCRVLKNAGAGQVSGWVAARAPPP